MEKLVRDQIPEIMQRDGVVPEIRKISSEERLPWLLKKLNEEVDELVNNPVLDECADVYEVLITIAAHIGFSIQDVEHAALKKRVERGGFSSGILLSLGDS